MIASTGFGDGLEDINQASRAASRYHDCESGEGRPQYVQAVILYGDWPLPVGVVDNIMEHQPQEWDPGYSKDQCRGHSGLGALIKRGVDQFSYTYDFGDNWQHSITIETVAPANPAIDYPRFIDGPRRAFGGVPGFEEFLGVMTRPRHPERKRFLTWYRRVFDPEDIDLPTINTRVGKLDPERSARPDMSKVKAPLTIRPLAEWLLFHGATPRFSGRSDCPPPSAACWRRNVTPRASYNRRCVDMAWQAQGAVPGR